MVPEELPCDDPMVLLDHLQVLLIEALPEPGLVPRLLKEPRGHVANNVRLRGRGAGSSSEMTSPALHFHLSEPAHPRKGTQTGSDIPSPEALCFRSPRQIPVFPVTNGHVLPTLCAFAHAVPTAWSALLTVTSVNPSQTSKPSSKNSSL